MPKIVDIKGRGTKTAHKPPVEAPASEDASTREYNRTPWSGNLDEDEIQRPGGLLLAALIHCANERRLQLNDMAKELGVTYGYINQLRNGFRAVNQVGDDFALGCARFLGVPRLTVLMLAGRITPADAFENRDLMAGEIGRAMAFICQDPEWGHMVTAELRNSSLESQFLLVRMYEAATKKVLMNTLIDIETLAEKIAALQELQAARARANAAHAVKKSHET